MKIRHGLFAVTAASVLAMSPALAQQSGGGQQGAQGGSQIIEQEQPSGSGAQYSLSPATVRQIQQALNQGGYDAGPVDGTWGKQTSQAMSQFQQAQGLEPTGQPNDRSLAALGIEQQPAGGMQAQSPQQGQVQAGGGSGGGQGGSSGGKQQGGGSSGGSSGSSQGGGSSGSSGGSSGSSQGGGSSGGSSDSSQKAQ